MIQETRFQVQVLKPCKSVQETSEEVLDFKDRQLVYRGFKGCSSPMLDSFLIDRVSIEIYENQFFRSDFIPIRVYMFRLSFLTTLNIYKDYFKDHKRWRECDAKSCSCKL